MQTEDTLLEFSVTPVGHNPTDSIRPTIAKVVKKVKTSGLPNEIHAMGTVVEGELDACLDLVKECVREVLKEGPRVSATVRLDVRPGHPGRMEASVKSVEENWKANPVSH